MNNIQYYNTNTVDTIVNQQDLTSIAFARDKDEPYTYKEWVESSGISDSNQPVYREMYEKYLTDWTEIKSQPISESAENTKEMFQNFLKQLPVDGSADDLRYINNIDYNDQHEVETALQFFSKYLRKTSSNIADNREQVKFETAKNSIRGSSGGVPVLVRNYIIQLLQDETYITRQMLPDATRDAIIQEMVVSVQELYDDHNKSSDQLNESAKTTVQNTVKQHIEYDPYMFIDDTVATQNLLAKYGNALSTSAAAIQTNTQNDIVLDFTPDISTVQQLPQSEFESYDNINLNLSNVKRLVEQSTGTTTQYLSSDTSGQYVTGVLFDTKNNLSEYRNTKPGIVFDESNNTQAVEQIGGYYVPSKLGVIDYYSYDAQQVILDEHIQPDKLYTYNPQNIHIDDSIPVDHIENFTYVKNNTLESGTPGEITAELGNIPRFNNYQSKEQTNLFSTTGLSRSDDSYDFWTGDVDGVWANSDVYENITPNILQIDDRQTAMLTNSGHLYEWKTDSYGNEYGLLKQLKQYDTLTDANLEPPALVTACGIVDGDAFKDKFTREPPVTDQTFNESVISFISRSYDRVVDGRTFFDVGCVFDQPELESLVVDIPYAAPGTTFCSFYDGYIFSYEGEYEEISTNIFNSIRLSDPPIDKIWDCGDFNTMCVPAPVTEAFYKISDVNIRGQSFVDTEFQSTPSTQTMTLTDQQTTPGDLVVRLGDSSEIHNFSVICDNIIKRYTTTTVTGEQLDIREEIHNNLHDFSVIGDIIMLKTSKLLILDKIEFNYSNSTISAVSNPIILPRVHIDGKYKLSQHFYNEYKKEIVLCGTRTHTVQDTTGRNLHEDQLAVDIFYIDVMSFKLNTHQPEVMWREQSTDLLRKSMYNIATPHVLHNTTTDNYYVVFMCNYNNDISNPSSDKVLAICHMTITSKTQEQLNPVMYTSQTPSKGAIDNLSDEQREVVNFHKIQAREHLPLVGQPPVNDSVQFRNSIHNELHLDLSKFYNTAANQETATLVEVYFDDRSTTPDYIRTRKPVQVYDDFELMIGEDSRDPRNYLIKHTYHNTEPVTCRVVVYTLQSIEAGTYREYKIRVYGDTHVDLSTAFGLVDNDNRRIPGHGIEIHKATAFSNEYGVEHVLLLFRTINPDYISPVMLRLLEPVREQHQYEINDDQIVYNNKIDMSTIDHTYSVEPQEQVVTTVYESGSVPVSYSDNTVSTDTTSDYSY